MSTFKQIKAWYKLLQPHKGYLLGTFLSAFFGNAIPVFQAIPNANVITSLTTHDYNGAIFWLLISLACTVLHYLSWHLNYKYYYLLCKHDTLALSGRIYGKVSLATREGLRENSVERIMMVTTTNVETLTKFSDHITYQLCHLLRAFLTTIIVCVYNIYIGLIMFAITILMYFWYVYLGKLAHKHSSDVIENREIIGDKINDVVNGKIPTQKLNLNATNKSAYLQQIKSLGQSYSKRGLVNCTRKYWTYAVLYIIVTALTIWLASLTNANPASLSIYLILAPYLISIIDQLKAGYDVIYELQKANVARLKVETLLNMPTNDIVTYNNNTTDKLTQNLVFSNVSFFDNNVGENKSGSLSKVSLEIEPNSITLIKGLSSSGKRSIFYMLRRAIVPTTGTITMDGINIYDFDKNTYKHNFSYATSKPYFYSESILDNLLYACPSKKKIIKVCKSLNIHKEILKLSNEYETNLIKEKELISDYLLFMIGLARAILSDSEWIAIYEFPSSLTSKEIATLKEYLLTLKQNCSIIIFSANDLSQDICDNYYSINSGHIRKLNKVEG